MARISSFVGHGDDTGGDEVDGDDDDGGDGVDCSVECEVDGTSVVCVAASGTVASSYGNMEQGKTTLCAGPCYEPRHVGTPLGVAKPDLRHLATISSFIGHGGDDAGDGDGDGNGVDSSFECKIAGCSVCVAASGTVASS